MASTAAIQPAWTLQSQDTAAVGRYHDGALLQSLSATANAVYRTGVIPTVATSGNGTAVDLIVTQAASPNMTVIVDAGNAVVGNSSGRGPYLCENTANQTLTVSTADPTNPRIDLVYIQVIDTVAGDTGSSATQVGIVTGTPASSPAVPALPTNGVSLSLAQVRVNAGVTSITGSNITDVRKSAGIGRGPRWLLPGDALSDPGFCYGELRQRPQAGYTSNGLSSVATDYWGYDSNWHGTNEYSLPISAQAWQNGTSDVTISTSAFTDIIRISVPDPGFRYVLEVSASVQLVSASAWTPGVAPGAQIRVSLTSNTGTKIAESQAFGFQTAAGSGFVGCLPSLRSGELTGAQTVVFSGKNLNIGTGGALTAPYAEFVNNGGASNFLTWLDVLVVPV